MIDNINLEIQQICNELVEEAKSIAQLPSVSHLSKSKIQFSGGIIGGIQEYREGKRLEKLLNAPICKGWTFYTYAFHLIDTAEELVKNQLEVQKVTTENDNCYFSNVNLIVSSITIAHKAWFEYSPDMAWASVNVGDIKNVSLELSVDRYTKEEFQKLHLPEGLSFSIKQESTNGGCLGLLLFFIIGGICTFLI